MKKFRVLFIGTMLLFVLAACSANEQDEIIGVHEDFSDLMDDAEDEFENIEFLINDYTLESISEDDFEEEKAKVVGFFDDLKKDLDKIDQPKTDRAIEYYELSYNVVDEMIIFSKEMLELPDLEEYDAVLEYQGKLEESINSLGTAIEDLSVMHEELEAEDDAYKEAFND